MVRYSYTVVVMILFVCSVLLTTTAMGQSGENLANSGTDEYSEQELKEYARAANAVERINEAYIKQLAQTEGTEARNRLRQVAMDQMIQRIRETDISLDKYNEITVKSGNRPTLAHEINRLKRQLQ
ncbi:MAG: DUF4168 domain-containing protein [Rhodospirillales bacterium]